MAYTNRFTEDNALLAQHDPRTRQVATHTSAWVLMKNYHRGFFELQLGDMGAAATVDADLQQAQDAVGTGVKAITGKAITQLTQAGGDGVDDVAGIELQSEELDVDNGFEFVRFRVIIGVADCTYSATFKGCVSRYKPVPTTLYTEIVG